MALLPWVLVPTYHYSLVIPPQEECRTIEVTILLESTVLVQELLSREVEVDIIGLGMQDSHFGVGRKAPSQPQDFNHNYN